MRIRKTTFERGASANSVFITRTKIDDFGSRIELSSSNPDRNDRTDLPHLFGIVNGPGKAIFGSKIMKM